MKAAAAAAAESGPVTRCWRYSWPSLPRFFLLSPSLFPSFLPRWTLQ